MNDLTRLTRMFGKVYYWSRVNGQLQLRPALTSAGEVKPEALRRIAEGR